MRGINVIRSRTLRVFARAGVLMVLSTASLHAETKAPQMNVMYECMVPYSFKFLSCTGTSANDACDVQSFYAGHPFQRGRSTYPQVLNLLARCHLQTPAEAQADARSASTPLPNMAANQGGTGPGGFKVGDTVRVLIDGWQEAQVIQVHGASYVVHLPNGVDVSKLWPTEVRRVGKLTAEDHAAGQYDRGDRVQVLVNSRWMEGEVRGQNLNMYNIKVSGVDTGLGDDHVDTTPENIRVSMTAPPLAAATRAAGQVPKPGLASCAGRYEGRWELAGGMAGMKVIFSSGRATVSEGLGGAMPFDCFTGGGKVVFYKAGSFQPFDYDFDINNDGTLQTPLGAIKKMGN
jgi:protein involved in polysaccharide export with SLBB domain